MKAFLISLCVICVAYSLLNFLPGEKGTGKMIRFICALCFLISLIGAVSGVEKQDFSFSFSPSDKIDYSVVSVEAFSKAIGQMLDKENITYEKISVDSSENEDGSISINEIAVYGVTERQRCERVLKENTGLSKEVRIYE